MPPMVPQKLYFELSPRVGNETCTCDVEVGRAGNGKTGALTALSIHTSNWCFHSSPSLLLISPALTLAVLPCPVVIYGISNDPEEWKLIVPFARGVDISSSLGLWFFSIPYKE